MNNYRRLNDVFPLAIIGNGIFEAMGIISPLPFDVSPLIMDVEYFGNVSGNKICSPLVDTLVLGSEVTQAEKETLADIIKQLYYDKWENLYNTFKLQYNPIQNYDMVETMADDKTIHQFGRNVLRTDNLSHTKTGTETQTDDILEQRKDALKTERVDNLSRVIDRSEVETDDLTEEKTDNLKSERRDNLSKVTSKDTVETHDTEETETPDLTNNTNNKVFGFNSEVAVDTDAQEMRAEGTTTKDKTGTITTEEDATETNTGTQTTNNTGTVTNEKTGTVTKDTDETETNTGTQTTNNTGTQDNIRQGTVETEHNTVDSDTGTQNTAESGTNTDTRNYTLRRSGNIGVTTSQQMIQAERDLWLWDFIHSVVFPDVDKVLAIQIY